MNSQQKKEFYRKNNKNKSLPIDNKGSIAYDIHQAETIDLTGKDIEKICDGKVKVLSYHELQGIPSIEALLEPFGAVVLLYETKENFGHYTALFYDAQNNLEFFDSYGFAPDQELNYATYDNTPYLSQLLSKYKGRIVYNTKRLQQWAKDVNTCGRWTASRIRLRNLNPTQFENLFKTKYYNPDFFISAITYLYTYN